jgi:hypothetical protein
VMLEYLLRSCRVRCARALACGLLYLRLTYALLTLYFRFTFALLVLYVCFTDLLRSHVGYAPRERLQQPLLTYLLYLDKHKSTNTYLLRSCRVRCARALGSGLAARPTPPRTYWKKKKHIHSSTNTHTHTHTHT